MEGALIVLIPISVLVVAGIVAVLWWAARQGQFDDLEGPGHAILMDDDRPPAAHPAERKGDIPDAAQQADASQKSL